MTTPTQRSLKLLRDEGYRATVVERWNPFAHIRQDLWGFIDILAIRPGETVGVQSCHYSDVSKRAEKIANHENVGAVREAGWKIVIHGWHKVGNRYQVRIVDVS